MTSMPPGWYDDGRGALRWWDGTQWTEHVATPDPEPAPGSSPAAESPAAEPLPPELAEAEPTVVAPYGSTPGYPGADPAGYPGGFPGGAAPAGAFVSATEPKKSKTWIIWVVIGVVLLGIVIAAAVLLPLLFLTFAGGGSTTPEGDAETDAVAAVMLYDDAWQEVDCAKLEASTTEDFREAQGLADCADFEEASQSFSDAVDNYEVVVTSIDNGGDTITIHTEESFDALYDDEGERLDEPLPGLDEYTYVVVSTADGWLIDDLTE